MRENLPLFLLLVLWSTVVRGRGTVSADLCVSVRGVLKAGNPGDIQVLVLIL